MKDFNDKESEDVMLVESILDLNSNNVWTLTEGQIALLWEKERQEGEFSSYEEKLLNVIRLAFEVVHYNPNDEREKNRYETKEWQCFSHCNEKKGNVAIRPKVISRITDLSYENIKHITAPTLLELIDRNFGGGWEAISLPIRSIIESGFDISTTQLPASRIHAPGGTLEKKVAQGFDVLEVAKGTWVEAIFAKKKEPVGKFYFDETEAGENSAEFDNLDTLGEEQKRERFGSFDEDDDAENMENENDMNSDDFEDNGMNEEELYSNYSPEAEVKDDLEDGFPVEE